MIRVAHVEVFLCVLASALLLDTSPAAAHSLHVFAEGDGATIRGKAHYHGGSPAKDARVRAFSPDGRNRGETRTDAQGAFSLPVTVRCDYRLLVVTDDGHGAEFRVPAEELSADLPPLAPDADAAKHGHSEGTSPAPPTLEPPPVLPNGDGRVTDELAAVRGQISALRQQLAEYEQRIRLRDVIGGIGYIFGLAGVAFYIAARRAGPVRKP